MTEALRMLAIIVDEYRGKIWWLANMRPDHVPARPTPDRVRYRRAINSIESQDDEDREFERMCKLEHDEAVERGLLPGLPGGWR